MVLSAKIIPLGIFYSAILSIGIYFPLYFLSIRFLPVFVYATIFICAGVFIWLSYMTISLYITFSAKLSSTVLTVRKGFFVKREKLIRLEMSQSVKIFSTPLMRVSKLSMLIVAFEGSVVIFPPADKNFALKIYNIAGNQI